MSDTQSTEPARAHVRIVFLGPVAPHWDVVGDFGDRTLIDEFRTRAMARLVLLPYTDPSSSAIASGSCVTANASASRSNGTSASTSP
ncbi:MAG: hypothetical protein ACKOHN_05650 [Actinomycetota bacterium]